MIKASMVNVFGRRWRCWLIIAIALLLINLSGCTTIESSPDSSQNRYTNRILEFVPKQSLFAAVIDASIKSDKLWQRSTLAAEFTRMGTSVFSPLVIDFDEDIRPWLGNEIAFAITDKDIDRNQYNGRQAGYLLAANIADGERAREFLELFWQRQSISGHPPLLTESSGVPIISGEVSQENRQLATAVIGRDILLVANDVKVLQQSLRVAQAHDLHLVRHDCCSTTWLNLRVPDFLDWLGIATPEKLQLTSTLRWQTLQAAIELSPQQIVINTALTGLNPLVPTSSNRSPDVSKASGPSQYVPADAAWAAMGNDLLHLWTELNDELTHYQRLPSVIQQKQQWLSTQLAQSLAVPLTQLLVDDYAVAQLADGTWLLATVNTNPIWVEQLDNLAMNQGLTVGQLMLQGHLVTVWSRLKTRVDTRNRETTVETDVVGVHTQIDTGNVFATSLAGLTKALTAPKNRQLSTTQEFQHALQSMDRPNQGYFYGTWSKLDRLLENSRWFSLVKPILQPWSQSIDAISITSYTQTTNQSTGTVSILLKN